MKTGIYWQDPKYAVGRDFIFDPSLVLYLPLYKLDGASFMSKDKLGHLCTVTGALWTPNGRLFDGNDDHIDCPVLTITNATIELWVYLLSNTNTRYLTDNRDTDSAGTGYIYVGGGGDTIGKSAGTVYVDTVATSTCGTLAWHLVQVTGITLTPGGGGDNKFTVGSRCTFVTSIDGRIGEVRVYNRALTPLERQHNYLASKWRYQ